MQSPIGFETDDFHGHSLAWFGRSFSNVCRIGKGAERPAIADAAP
jgi:hypothetical protein